MKAFHKVAGRDGRRLYALKRGAWADLSGFTVKHAAVEQLSEAEAKRRHPDRSAESSISGRRTHG